MGNKNNFKHGYFKTKLYGVWSGIKDRCVNSNNTSYKDYGGRGITICDEWLEFTPFRDWALANGYQEGLEIDREDNNSNYIPENCHFVTKVYNRRKTRRVKLTLDLANEIRELHKKDKYTQKELGEIYKVDSSVISNIINNKRWKN